MTVRGGWRNLIKIFNTGSDLAPTVASLADLNEDGDEVFIRALEAGTGVSLEIVDSDNWAATPWKRVRIHASGGGGGGSVNRKIFTMVWSSGTTSGPTVTISNAFIAASPDTVTLPNVDVFINGLRLYAEDGGTFGVVNQFDVVGYDLVISTSLLGYQITNGDRIVVDFLH